MIYYVIYGGVGRDGGFGDYAGTYWDDTPIAVDGKTIWLQSQSEAEKVVEHLNNSSWEAFRAAGHGVSYTGEFPIEYEWREIVVPTSDHVSHVEAIELITESDGKLWKHGEFDDE